MSDQYMYLIKSREQFSPVTISNHVHNFEASATEKTQEVAMGQNSFPGGSSRLTTVHLLRFGGRGTENLNIGLNTRGKEMGSRAHTLLVGSDTRASRRSSRLSRVCRVRFPVRVHSPCAAGVRCGGRYCHRFHTNKFILPTYDPE